MARAKGVIVGFADDCRAQVKTANAFAPIVLPLAICGMSEWTDDAADWLRNQFPEQTEVWFSVSKVRKRLQADIWLSPKGEEKISDAAIDAGIGKAVKT